MTRPLRFGLLSSAGSAKEWQRDVARAEGDGYSSIVLTDHLDLSGAHATRLAWLPALADALARTTRLRASVMVANQDLRHPAVLAREATTLDLLSGGRLELGVGAGWVEAEYAWAGLTYDPAPVRVARLAEYCAVIRGLTTSGAELFSFSGQHFSIDRMPVAPIPVAGRLPLMVGGARPRVLGVAARVADIVNINTLRDDGPADVVLGEKVGWVRAAAGERFDELELAMSVPLVAGGTGSPVDAVRRTLATDGFARHVAERVPLEALASAAFTLAGTTDEIAVRLQERRDRHGISYVVLPAHAADVMGPVLARLA